MSGYIYITLSAEMKMQSTASCSVTINSLNGVCTTDIGNRRVKLSFQ